MNPIEDALANRPKWMSEGICAQTDPDAFFLERGGNPRPAKAVCARCPVTAECLQYAIDNDEPFGIWGGKSERERRGLRERGPMPKHFQPPKRDPILEAEVLVLLGQGLSVTRVAELADVSVRTVGRIRDAHENGAAA